MKLIFPIALFVFLTFSVFGADDEHQLLEELERTIHSNFEKMGELLEDTRPFAKNWSDDGKLQYVLYDILYQSTSNDIDSLAFDEYLSELSVQRVDAAILQNFRVISISNDQSKRLFDINELKTFEKKTKHAGRRALLSVLIGFDQDYDESIKYFDKSLKNVRKTRISFLPCIIFNILSIKKKHQGKYKEALKYYQKGLNYSTNKGYSLFVLQYSLSIASVQLEMDNLKKAKSFFKRSLSLSEDLKNDWYLSLSLRGLGNVNLISNNLSVGINHFQKALVIYYQKGSDLGVAQTHENLGKAYFLRGEYELAEQNYDLSRTFYSKIIKSDNGEDELFEGFALLKYEQKKFKEALKLINKCIEMRESMQINEFELNESYGVRSKIYAALGMGERAYNDLYRSARYKDSIYSVHLQQQIADLSELYESEQKSKRIFEQEQKLREERNERLLKEQELENTELRNRQIILTFSFSILLLVAIFLIFYFKNKQHQLKRQQIEVELRQQLLRSQMNPHFVFNAMSVIQSYIYDNDIEKSSEFLVNLSRLMRLILENSAKESIKLNTELEILERYLLIQQERFENRFEFEIIPLSVIDTEKVTVPPMILQPFIENATEHGELDKAINGKIRITYKIEDQLLIFVIEDNGIGRKASKAKGNKRSSQHKSMAISITEKRIELLLMKYKVKGYIYIEDLDEVDESGTKVTIAMPLID
jgi:tetratricopeptide (TPR) repeat protein